MRRFIDAERLKAEIGKRKNICNGVYERDSDTYYQGKAVAYQETLSLIDSLQQEQPCGTCTNDKGCVTCKDGELWEGKEQQELITEVEKYFQGLWPGVETAEQCGDNPTVTASGRQIQPEKVAELRIIAMERTMMQRNGIHYGDTILVKGTGIYDGEWVVEDTMHPRNAGQDRIDFLVPEEIKLGRWDNVEVYKRSKK